MFFFLIVIFMCLVPLPSALLGLVVVTFLDFLDPMWEEPLKNSKLKYPKRLLIVFLIFPQKHSGTFVQFPTEIRQWLIEWKRFACVGKFGVKNLRKKSCFYSNNTPRHYHYHQLAKKSLTFYFWRLFRG